MEALYEELRRIDPQRAEKLHHSDRKRILRALEVWYETGRTMTEHDAEDAARPPRYQALTLALSFADRADLHARIDRRVDEMMAAGLEREVRALLRAGVPDTCTAMQAIGYKDLAAAIRSGGSVTEAAEEVKLRSRQYAKRQLTWFGRNLNTRWVRWDDPPEFEQGRRASTEYMEEVSIS